jgi:hypothetical protein
MAQQRMMFALARKGEVSMADAKGRARASKGEDLPEHVKKHAGLDIADVMSKLAADPPVANPRASTPYLRSIPPSPPSGLRQDWPAPAAAPGAAARIGGALGSAARGAARGIANSPSVQNAGASVAEGARTGTQWAGEGAQRGAAHVGAGVRQGGRDVALGAAAAGGLTGQGFEAAGKGVGAGIPDVGRGAGQAESRLGGWAKHYGNAAGNWAKGKLHDVGSWLGNLVPEPPTDKAPDLGVGSPPGHRWNPPAKPAVKPAKPAAPAARSAAESQPNRTETWPLAEKGDLEKPEKTSALDISLMMLKLAALPDVSPQG